MAQLSGKCLCGAVTVQAEPEAEELHACHCRQCRSWAAGPFLAVGCGDKVMISGGDAVGVFQSSPWAERVFCKQCGTSIAWRLQGGGAYHVAASLFEPTDAYPLTSEVFIDEKPEAYSFEQKTTTMTGAEIFAKFAPPPSSDQ